MCSVAFHSAPWGCQGRFVFKITPSSCFYYFKIINYFIFIFRVRRPLNFYFSDFDENTAVKKIVELKTKYIYIFHLA